MLIPEPIKVKVELVSNEVEMIIEELERVPHNTYSYFGYEKISRKAGFLKIIR